MSNRSRAISLLSVFALAAGCSASATSFTDTDAGPTGAKVDAGAKKDSGTTTTTDDAGDELITDAGKKKETGTTVDAGDIDAGNTDDGSVILGDSGGTDAASVGDTGLVCGPQAPSGFSPTWKAPAALHQNKCTTTQIDTFMDCVFYTNLPQATCDAFAANSANATCKSCLFTDEAATTYGPVVSSFGGDLLSLNAAGCIARTSNDVTATGCGAKVQAARQCEEAACKPSCPTADNDYLTCTDNAVTVCSSYETAAACADALQAADAAAETCDSAIGADFIENAKRYGRLFCTP